MTTSSAPVVWGSDAVLYRDTAIRSFPLAGDGDTISIALLTKPTMVDCSCLLPRSQQPRHASIARTCSADWPFSTITSDELQQKNESRDPAQGLNLTRANYLVIMGPSWSEPTQDQAFRHVDRDGPLCTPKTFGAQDHKATDNAECQTEVQMVCRYHPGGDLTGHAPRDAERLPQSRRGPGSVWNHQQGTSSSPHNLWVLVPARH